MLSIHFDFLQFYRIRCQSDYNKNPRKRGFFISLIT